MAVALLCLALATCALALPVPIGKDYVRFDGSRVLRFTPQTEAQLAVVMNLRYNLTIGMGLDWWEEPGRVGLAADLRVPPAALNTVEKILTDAGISFSVMIPNVQHLVDLEMQARSEAKATAGFDFTQYHTLDEINAYVQTLPTEFPNLADIFVLGQSYQGRTIYAVKISTGTTNNSGAAKPGFWIDGGIHAREWISPATVLYMLNELLTGYGTDPTITKLVEAFDIYILPVFNVDGYVFTWTNNRLWRKTRSPNSGSSCIGTDPNRNFDYQWGTIGASGNPCDETYYGSRAFSEAETTLVGNFLKGHPEIKAYFNMHSYSQLWLSPWGYTNAKPADYVPQIDLATAAVNALTAVHGTRYAYGPSYTTIYPTSGSSQDWTYGALKIVYSYVVELRDTGQYGFLLPANQIIPTGEETFAAILVSLQYVLDH